MLSVSPVIEGGRRGRAKEQEGCMLATKLQTRRIFNAFSHYLFAAFLWRGFYCSPSYAAVQKAHFLFLHNIIVGNFTAPDRGVSAQTMPNTAVVSVFPHD